MPARDAIRPTTREQAMRKREMILLLGAALLGGALSKGCLTRDPLYCNLPDYPCNDPSRPYCDTTGDYEPDHISNTCIASPFDAMPVEQRIIAPATLTVHEG